MSALSSTTTTLKSFADEYKRETPSLLKTIDAFLIYVFLTGIAQLAYVFLVGTFPFNSFLSGFASTVGMFVLLVSLRMQIETSAETLITKEKAFADFCIGALLLFLVVLTFMG
eukprot:TRINITY_DN6475_c0_g1_i1.p4 TRINITY_DN6475_c0_g1~~TRINITY_DN6475_c0_g1_i1.p4  ORF type:complete len:113 (-),score=56.03 TRINITY_DN6475_c0_g1_i1:57-395(-)